MTSNPPGSPIPETLRPRFTAQQCADCAKALRLLNDLDHLWPKMQACGIECGQHQELQRAFKERLEAIRHYFMDPHDILPG